MLSFVEHQPRHEARLTRAAISPLSATAQIPFLGQFVRRGDGSHMANDPSELRKEKVCKQVVDGLHRGSHLSAVAGREAGEWSGRLGSYETCCLGGCRAFGDESSETDDGRR